MAESPGYLTQTVQTSIGWDLAGLLKELEAIPDRIQEIREKIAPLRAELKMRQERYASRGRSPSHSDIIRSTLMAKLKEEERQKYNTCPDTRTDAKTERTVKVELTDGRCEDLAHARPEYQEFVRNVNREHKRIAAIGRELGPLYDQLELIRGRKEYLTQRLEAPRAFVEEAQRANAGLL